MIEKPSNVAIIGAGPAGLTAAYQLAKAGIRVTVFETSNAVGGMSKTISLWGQLVDLGPHRFFSKDPYINNLWLEVAGNDFTIVNRLTRIFYKNKFYDYPLEPLNALKNLGIVEALICVVSYVWARLFPKKETSNFESWVTNKFGARLFSIFFKSYSEKLWGIPCNQLNADFAIQRIKKLSLFEAVKDAFFKSLNKHNSLIDKFYYPLQGTGSIYEKMAAEIIQLGGEIHLNSSAAIKSADTEKSIILRLPNGSELSFDYLVSSMPITALVHQLNAPSHIKECANHLKFRNTILIYLLVKGSDHFPDQWIYVHAPDLQTGRITNFRNWCADLNTSSSDTILCLEYWCNTEDELWLSDNNALIEMASKEAYATTLIPAHSILKGEVVRIPNSYPVYDQDYKKHLQPIQNYFDQFKNLALIGRYGSFKYNNQDHSILMGMLVAEKIAGKNSINLWNVNTDDTYQETGEFKQPALD